MNCESRGCTACYVGQDLVLFTASVLGVLVTLCVTQNNAMYYTGSVAHESLLAVGYSVCFAVMCGPVRHSCANKKITFLSNLMMFEVDYEPSPPISSPYP